MSRLVFAFVAVLLFASDSIAQTGSELAKDCQDLIRKFDNFYFESADESIFDEKAKKLGYDPTPNTRKYKIARMGEKRYLQEQFIPTPGPKPKYSARTSVYIFDGNRSLWVEGPTLYTQKSKNLYCELNGAFYSLGWEESKEALDEPREKNVWARKFLVEMLQDESAKWSVSNEKVGDIDCKVASSDKFKTTMWFNAKTMMPEKYESLRNEQNIYNKTVEFLDYQRVEGSELTFPNKIVVSCDLFNEKSGEAEGKSVVTLNISKATVTVPKELFQLDEAKYHVTDLDEWKTKLAK